MRACLLLLGLFLLKSPTIAATYIWTGNDGTDDSWSNADNWGGLQLLKGQGDLELIFPPLDGPYESNNDVEDLQVTSLVVTTEVGDGDYMFTGNPITISRESTMANPGTGSPNLVWQIPIVLSGDVTMTTTGRLTQLEGAIDLGSRTLTLATAGDVMLGGVVSGSGRLVKNNRSALTIIAANTYTGMTISNGGALYIASPEALGDSAAGTIFNAGFLGFFPGSDFTTPESFVFNGGSILAYGTSTIAGNVTLLSTVNVDAFDLDSVLTISGAIDGDGGLNKVGPGLLILDAPTNPYAGATTIEEGTLQLDSTLSGSEAVTVGNAATLKGNGSTAGTIGIQDGGTIAPGSSPGELSSEALNLTAGAIFSAEISGPNAADDYDTISVAGPLMIDGAMLEVSLLYAPPAGQRFTLISQEEDQPVNGTFAGLPEGATFSVDGTTFAITYIGGSGNDVVLVTAPTSTPTHTPTEPLPATPTSTPTRTTTTVTTATATPTSSVAPPTATPTPTISTIPTATATGSPPGCTGDCDDDGTIGVSDLVLAVAIALDEAPGTSCPQLAGDGSVSAADLVQAVDNALSGCAQ